MARPLLIVMGQSNCFGQTATRTLPAQYLSLPYSAWKWVPLNPSDPRQRRRPWSPLRPSLSYDYLGSPSWAGPDLVAAKVLGDAGHTPTVFWHAAGATSLSVDWAVGGGGMGLYANAVAEVGRAFASTNNPGNYSSAWLIWIQGESDGIGGFQAAYKTNWDAWWPAYKTAISASIPSIRCVMVKLSSNASAVTNLAAMRTQYDLIAAAHSDVTLYDATPCAMAADNLHYSETGLETLGTGIANAMIAAGSL